MKCAWLEEESLFEEVEDKVEGNDRAEEEGQGCGWCGAVEGHAGLAIWGLRHGLLVEFW